jgi:hypothetical protein
MALIVGKARATLESQITVAPATQPDDAASGVRTDFSLYGQTRQ